IPTTLVWQVVTSPQSDFSAEFPARPEITRDGAAGGPPGPSGGLLEVVLEEGLGFTVSWRDLSKGAFAKTPAEIVAYLFQTTGVTPIDRKDLKYNDHPGVEFTVAPAQPGTRRSIERAFAVRGTLYRLAVSSPPDVMLPATSVKRFLDSFFLAGEPRRSP